MTTPSQLRKEAPTSRDYFLFLSQPARELIGAFRKRPARVNSQL